MDKLSPIYLSAATSVMILLMLSCGNPQSDDKYLLTLDTLEKKVDMTDSVSQTIPFEKAEKVAATIVKKIDSLNALDGGKHPEDIINLVSTYSVVRWFELTSGEEEEREKEGAKHVFETEKEPGEMLEKQIEYSRTQLKNLRHDYMNKNVTPVDANKFLGDEKRAVNALYEYACNKSILYKTHLAAFDSLDPLIDKSIERLSKK